MPIPIIDLFAGPGGLGEGFSAFLGKDCQAFTIGLSIEKNMWAHQTLELRSFFRQFDGKAPDAYYDYLAGNITREVLFAGEKEAALRARNEAWHAQLGGKDGVARKEVHKRVKTAIGQNSNWVLIGGPPCQAYSLIGRSRIMGADRRNGTDDYSKDHRHRLYQNYLRILAFYAPSVFVMENVKGILSSQVNGNLTFNKILADLQNPPKAICASLSSNLEYKIYSLSSGALFPTDPHDYVIRSENYGIPQRRHRVILFGVRDDISSKPDKLTAQLARTVVDTIGHLPRLRSSLSREEDTDAIWLDSVKSALTSQWIREVDADVSHEIEKAIDNIRIPRDGRGGRCVAEITGCKYPAFEESWYADDRLPGYCNHETRGHIRSDLHRYLFASCFAKAKHISPKISDFPRDLYPDHWNVKHIRPEDIIFADRFRVQIKHEPATTIVSHIAKDGHYFIHYDPTQCRSMTVREAARLQTFPDNYFFEGPRTEQYTQVGNAVPPLLARKIAAIVAGLFRR